MTTASTIRAFIGHGSYVNSIAFSADGRYILSSARFENAARLWSVDTGQQIRSLVGHAGIVRAVALSPDSRYALTASDDKTVRVWDLYNGAEFSILSDPTTDIYTVGFSPDGTLAASGGDYLALVACSIDCFCIMGRGGDRSVKQRFARIPSLGPLKGMEHLKLECV